MTSMRLRRAFVCTVAAGAALLTTVASGPPGAEASTTPLPDTGLEQSVSGTLSPLWQTNDAVDAIAVSGGVAYVGGRFTRVRPPGAAPGTDQTRRNYLAAFDATTGALVASFNPNLDGRVVDLAVSPDGRTLYVGGYFTTVGGVTRKRVAALDLPSGTLDTGWRADANRQVTAIEATADAVYVTGGFTTVQGTARARLAALSPDDGTVDTGFRADLDAAGQALAVSPDGTRLLVGGSFTTVGGTRTGGMASVAPGTGALRTWAVNDTQSIGLVCEGRVTDIAVQGATAYVTAEGDPPGCYEGTYSARVSDGRLNWINNCLGASQGITILKGVLYKASHQHDCAFNPGDARGGFVGGVSRETFERWHLVGQRLDTGQMVHWSPDTNGTGNQPIGPHVIRADGTQLFVGGDFTTVDGVRQQGLARFGPGAGATPVRPQAPTVLATGAGHVTVTWPATYDADTGRLTYRLYRGATTKGTPVSTQTVESWPWTTPTMRYDEERPVGDVRYRVTASDGVHTSPGSRAGRVTVGSTDPAPYASLVGTYGGSLHWDLDGSGTTLGDSSGQGRPGRATGGVSRVAGAFGGGTAVRLDGSTGYLSSEEAVPHTSSYSQSLWFRTTTIDGGSLFAVANRRTGRNTDSDQGITMDNNGNLVFTTAGPPSPLPFPALNTARNQGPVYNDGRWHFVVATYASAKGAQRLYVDGALTYELPAEVAPLSQGYARVGYADLSDLQSVFGTNFYDLKWPSSEFFDGSIDEVATFPSALSAKKVSALYAAGVAQGG